MIPKAIPMKVRHIVMLLIFFILYVIFGGLIFMMLESPVEQVKRKEIETVLKDFSEHIQSLNHPNITEQYIRLVVHKLLVAQNDNLINDFGEQKQSINWSFINSFFFAITVITTIGYGHLTATTVFGKCFCIIYALFGIPITGLLIGSIADRFSKLYSTKAGGTKRYQRQLSARFRMLQKGLISLVPWLCVFLIIPAYLFTHIENWPFLDGFYYCFITLSTIGFGDFVAGGFETRFKWLYMIIVVFWIVFGLAYLSMVLNFITQSLRSSHISNVMHTLRHRISINQSNRILRHHHHHHHHDNCHTGQFKRQQSSPMVLCSPEMYSKANLTNLNNNYINTISENCKLGNLDNKISCISIEQCNKPSRPRRLNFFKWLKSFRQSNKTNPIPTKNSLKMAYGDDSSVRPSSSLPEIKDCDDPCCSIDGNESCEHSIVGKITIV